MRHHVPDVYNGEFGGGVYCDVIVALLGYMRLYWGVALKYADYQKRGDYDTSEKEKNPDILHILYKLYHDK